VRKGKVEDVYRNLSDEDCERGFRDLAEELIDDVDLENVEVAKRMEGLLAAHRARRPKDVWLAYFEGELAHSRKKYDEAESRYSDAMKRAPDDETRDRFRSSRVENLFTAGRALEAYIKVGPSRAVFAQLTARTDDVPSLAGLIWIHQLADPADPALMLWRGTLAFRRKAYDAAVIELTAYLRSGPEGYDWQARDKLVRSLLRMKRFKEARQALRPDNEKQYFNRVLGAAITAASGDVAGTERELNELAKGDWAAAMFHADPDLAEALKTEPFRKLLEKYPAPKNETPNNSKK
jgi:tetratricopeptide (TPR) repeat protein